MRGLRERDFRQILSRYRLGDYKSAEPFATGAVQVNVRLTTTDGQFALKWYQNRTRERVLLEMDMLRHLQRYAFPAPLPIRNVEGCYVGEHKNKPVALCSIVPGKPIKKPGFCELGQLAECCANLHLVSRTYRPPRILLKQAEDREFFRQAARAEARKLGWSAAAKAKFEWIQTELNALKLPNSLPKGICHYDYHYSNSMFADGHLAGLVDFDDARYARLVFDIANLLDYWAWPHGREVDFKRAKRLLHEYQKRRQLNEAEKRHLFDAWKTQILLDAVYFFSRDTVEDCREKQKTDYLESLGRTQFNKTMFS